MNSTSKSFHKICTLEKEGITSSSTKKRHLINAPRHSQNILNGSSQKSSDSPRLFEVLPKYQWFHIGDGWLQSTSTGTGSLSRCGLHTIFESSPGNVYMCIYEPRSVEAHEACTASLPEYDLEFSTKLIKFTERKAGQNRLTGFHAIIAYKNESNFVSFMYSPDKKCWGITHRIDGKETILALQEDETIKYHVFLRVLVQVRGKSLSVDVNESPVFTNVRLNSGEAFDGLPGFCAEGGRFAVKQWRIRGVFRFHNHYNTTQTELFPTATIRPSEPCPQVAAVPHFLPTSSSSSMEGGSSGSVSGAILRPTSLLETMRMNQLTSGATSNRNNISSRPLAAYSPFPASSSQSQVDDVHQPAAAASSSLQLSQTGRSSHVMGAAVLPPAPPIPPQSSAPTSMSSVLAHLLRRGHDMSIAHLVLQDLVQAGRGVTFEDVAALSEAKRLLHEAIILPTIVPEFFTGIRSPWKGVLLFGPPGTGKTLLAKAVCSSQRASFFSCAASSLVSKFRGESEKIVRCLFEAARFGAPSVIFLDELDALVGKRSTEGQVDGHEASRRLKTELFTQMDGLGSDGIGQWNSHFFQRLSPPHSPTGDGSFSGGDSARRVVLLGATNCPWDLDTAMLRRLEKRIYIPLPDASARRQLFRLCLRSLELESDLREALALPDTEDGNSGILGVLAESTVGFSGADILIVCKDASMQPMRRVLQSLDGQPLDAQAIAYKRVRGELLLPMVSTTDILYALKKTNPSVPSSVIHQYEAWERSFSNT